MVAGPGRESRSSGAVRVDEVYSDDSGQAGARDCLPPPPNLSDCLEAGARYRKAVLGAGQPGSSNDLSPTTATDAKNRTLKAAPIPTIPGFEIISELGSGGMGIVYRARQISLNRVVALKVLHSGQFAGVADRARFRAEADAIARLRHSSFVQIYEFGETAGLMYLVLEYIEGGSLRQLFNGSPQPVPPVVQFVERLARAVADAHARGVVHRDLKPSNVLLNPIDRTNAADGAADRRLADFEPKVADFGLVKILDSTGTDGDPTCTGAVLGSPHYMAPEQAGGRARDAGPAADVYSLGAILYELLTGRPPLVAPTVAETLDLVRHEPPACPSRYQPGLARDLCTICLKCLEKEPARRYASATALADDLASVAQGRPIAARRVTGPERAWKWVRRKPALAAIAGLVGVGLVGAPCGYFAHRQHLTAERERRAAAETELQGKRRAILANFQQSHAAISQSVWRLAEQTLREGNRIELSDLSHAVWRDSLRFYREAFHDLDDSDPEMALAKATAHNFTGNVSYLLQDSAQADSELNAAYALLKPLVDTGHLESIRGVISYVHSDWPARRERENAPIEEQGPVVALFQLAQNLRLRGMVAHARGQMDLAISLLRDSVGEFERVLERAPQIPLARYFLAEAHYQLARIGVEVGDNAAVQRESSSAIDLLRLAMADDGEHPRYVVRFCDCAVLRLGEMLDAGRFDEARNVTDDVEAVLGRLCLADPGHIYLHLCRAENARLQGRVASARDRYEAALERISAGIDFLQPLARRHPDHENLRRQLASLYADKATAFCCLARVDEGERDWALADELSIPPEKWYFRACRAQERIRAGDFSRGADDAAALLDKKNLNAETLMTIVGIYARCLAFETDADLLAARSEDSLEARRVSEGHAIASREGPSLTRRATRLESAVACLERLAALDYFCEPRRVYRLYSDPALSSLRGSERFVAWLDAMRERYPDSPEYALVEADALRLVGAHRLEREEIDSAVADLSRGIDAARQRALGSAATDRDTRYVLEGLYWIRARARHAAGLSREAIADLREAIAFDSSPGRASTCIALGRALLEAHDITGAVAVLRELAAEPVLSGPGAYDLAILSAQIRSSFHASEFPSLPEFERLDQELYDQIVSSLNRALAGGFFESSEHRDEFRNNAFLTVFRGHPEFDSLLASLPMP